MDRDSIRELKGQDGSAGAVFDIDALIEMDMAALGIVGDDRPRFLQCLLLDVDPREIAAFVIDEDVDTVAEMEKILRIPAPSNGRERARSLSRQGPKKLGDAKRDSMRKRLNP